MGAKSPIHGKIRYTMRVFFEGANNKNACRIWHGTPQQHLSLLNSDEVVLLARQLVEKHVNEKAACKRRDLFLYSEVDCYYELPQRGSHFQSCRDNA